MSPRLALAVVLLTAPLAACSATQSTHGFQVVEAKPTDVKVGEDTKSTVTTRLGSPSVVSTFEPNIWFYITQGMSRKAYFKPRVTDREVVAIAFDETSEKVLSVNQYDLSAGKSLQFADRETPTRGRELTILEQLLGTIGRGSPLGNRDQDRTPGSRLPN